MKRDDAALDDPMRDDSDDMVSARTTAIPRKTLKRKGARKGRRKGARK